MNYINSLLYSVKRRTYIQENGQHTKMPKSTDKKKRRLPSSDSQAFGVARISDKFRLRYSAGVH